MYGRVFYREDIQGRFIMKYKNFEEWFEALKKKSIIFNVDDSIKELMRETWDAAVNNYPDTNRHEIENIGVKESKLDALPENEQNAAIGEQLCKLLNTINDAEKIDCTCDKKQLSTGYRYACQKGKALQQATIELGNYLRKIRMELK